MSDTLRAALASIAAIASANARMSPTRGLRDAFSFIEATALAATPAASARHDAENPVGSLDVAWREAEEACAKRGLILEEVARFNPNGWWTASAWEPKGDVPHTTATEQGVVAALAKLAARLTELEQDPRSDES